MRFAQLMTGKFGIKDEIDESGDGVEWTCMAKMIDKAVCGGMEEAYEFKTWNDVRKAVYRIDESWADSGTRKENKGFGFSDKEYATAIYLALRESKVTSRDDTDKRGDAWVDGKRSEFKAPSSRNAVQQRLKKAHTQNVDTVFLDVRGTNISWDFDTVRRAVNGQVQSFGGGPSFSEVWVIFGNSDRSLIPRDQRFDKVYG